MERVQLLKTLMSNLEKDEGVKKLPNISLKTSKALNISKEDRKIIRDFCGMCARLLELEHQYDCFLEADRKRSKIITTAICSFSENNIRIYCHERSLADILRSIAHEMFHLRQHELDLVPKNLKQHHLSPIEWHANAAGGSLLSYFAQKVGRDKIYR
jgi:hypothetical protein